MLCSWARHFTLIVPLSTQEYKWVPADCQGNQKKMLGGNLRWIIIPSRRSSDTPKSLNAMEIGISSGCVGHLHVHVACVQTLPTCTEPRAKYMYAMGGRQLLCFSATHHP